MLIDDGLELLTEDQCRELLPTMQLGRVGVTIGGLPVILPVNYAYDNGAIVFRTSEGAKLRAVASGSVIAFEIDSWDAEAATGWSVLAIGRAEELTDSADILRLNGNSPRPIASGDRSHYVRLRPELLSGRRIA
jgi:nitroimidazol reductase NimA-like FMN-containing flavoprotein (pyridoxamine 5'-phosphate oxidase superfamily)